MEQGDIAQATAEYKKIDFSQVVESEMKEIALSGLDFGSLPNLEHINHTDSFLGRYSALTDTVILNEAYIVSLYLEEKETHEDLEIRDIVCAASGHELVHKGFRDTFRENRRGKLSDILNSFPFLGVGPIDVEEAAAHFYSGKRSDLPVLGQPGDYSEENSLHDNSRIEELLEEGERSFQRSDSFEEGMEMAMGYFMKEYRNSQGKVFL